MIFHLQFLRRPASSTPGLVREPRWGWSSVIYCSVFSVCYFSVSVVDEVEVVLYFGSFAPETIIVPESSTIQYSYLSIVADVEAVSSPSKSEFE